MDSIHITRLLRMLLLLIAQVFVLNHMHLLGYATPLLIGFMITCFQSGTSRIGVLLWGFATGFLYDIFSNTIGMGAISCTLLAMMQPSILKLFTPNDAPDDFAPTMRNLEFWKYLSYLFICFLILHTSFYFLDAFSIENWMLTLTAIVGGTIISCIIALVIEITVRSSR